MPLNWKTPLPSIPVRTDSPVDSLAHITVPLLKDLSFVPLINYTLLPNLPLLSRDEIMTTAYRALNRRAQTLMMDQWRSLPLPSYDLFPLHLSPHRLMGLEKLMAGHIHQLRCHKSYLAAHPSMFYADDSPLCLFCGDQPETSSHAILCCPAKALARAHHL